HEITTLWDQAHPTALAYQHNLAKEIDLATADGVRVTLSLYPSRAKALTDSSRAPGEFIAWTAQVARTFPLVTDFIIGNEPNKDRFWQPQFNPNGTGAACAAY